MTVYLTMLLIAVASQPALAKVVNYLAPDVWAINELGGNNSSFNENQR